MQVAPCWQGLDSQGFTLSWHILPWNPGGQWQKWEGPLSMQMPPFWHTEETSVPGKRETQGSIKLGGVEGCSGAPGNEQRGPWRGH